VAWRQEIERWGKAVKFSGAIAERSAVGIFRNRSRNFSLHVACGSKAEELIVSTTSPVIPQLPTFERTLLFVVQGHKATLTIFCVSDLM
jgi:hypothetical protein